MRVALLCETFTRQMGYLETMLPKYLARLGVEVHVISTDLPPYYQMKGSAETYGGFMDGVKLAPGTVESYQGYTLHILPHRKVLGYMQVAGLRKKLAILRPDLVQTQHTIGWLPLQAAAAKLFLGYKLFTGNHYHASVFPLANRQSSPWSKELIQCRLTRTMPGWLVALCTEKCYAITSDCADVAQRFFGVSKSKIEVCPLGVDTELFHPISSEADRQARRDVRSRLGFSDHEIVCIYTGRFTEDKNPLLLAAAVERLVQQGESFRGLFVGNGVQAQAIQSRHGCVIHPFVPVQELGALFRAADIGVWPTQESTSMLDAAACGLPIVANHTMSAPERIDGNGATYKQNDLNDMVRVLLSLKDEQERQRLGSWGAEKMARDFSWAAIARRRLHDYQAALGPVPLLTGKPVSKELAGGSD